MKIGMVTDSLGHLTFEEMLEAAADLGLETLEFTTGNWSTAPHLDLDALLESKEARTEFLAQVRDHGLTISALNAGENQLDPGTGGPVHDRTVRRTIELAELLGVERVVMMSGLPGGEGDAHPNWITVTWPPETDEILEYQWDRVALPYWKDLGVCGWPGTTMY